MPLGDPNAPSEELLALQHHRPLRNISRGSRLAPDRRIRVSGVPNFSEDGVFLGYRISGTDITALLGKEEALRLSEQRLRDFAEQSSDWFWEMDENLRFTWISNSVESIIGDPADWHYGKTRSEINLADMDKPEWQEHLAILERREPYSDYLQHRNLPDGDR